LQKRSFDLTLAFGVHASERAKLTGRGLLYINNNYHAKPKINRKSKKSTAKHFSVDLKSTIKSLKTSKTRYQLTSLLKNTKKINIDQL